MSQDKPIPVGHTCPSIDKVKSLIRRNFPDVSSLDREEAFRLLEELRSANEQLRKNASFWEREIKKTYPTEWERLRKVQ